jgi:prepilin signal peptidase PulO-like enzyme (type II secretory pathway)
MGSYLYPVLALLFGWACGILLNYLADTLPLEKWSAAPVCLKCGRPMDLKNYCLWPRKCTSCGTRRSWRTWIVEILAASGGLWLWLAPPDRLGFVVGLALLMYCGLIVIIDIEHRSILHTVSMAGAILGFGIGVWMHGAWETLLGGVIGFGTMLLLFYAGKGILKIIGMNKSISENSRASAYLGVRSEASHTQISDINNFRTDTKPGSAETEEVKEALGFGDVILGGIIGLMLGYQMILTGLVVAVFIGCIYSFLYLFLLVITRQYKMLSMIPYGPFLVASAVILLYFPEAARVLAARL